MGRRGFSGWERNAFLDSCDGRRNQGSESHFQGFLPAQFKDRRRDIVSISGTLLHGRAIRSGGFKFQHGEFIVPIRMPETTEDECLAKRQGCVAQGAESVINGRAGFHRIRLPVHEEPWHRPGGYAWFAAIDPNFR